MRPICVQMRSACVLVRLICVLMCPVCIEMRPIFDPHCCIPYVGSAGDGGAFGLAIDDDPDAYDDAAHVS